MYTLIILAMSEEKRTLENAVYELDAEFDSNFCMLNGAIYTNKTDIPYTGLDYVSDNTGLQTGWTIKIKQGKKIGEVMDRIPFGILNKTITGLGATTLEISNQERNSIIIVPTKALAYNKYIWANNTYGQGYAFYVGSPIKTIRSNITKSKIKDYIQSNINRKNKFLVVADSLPLLIETLLELDTDIYNTYFLMIDEIDTMQADSVYRPKLEVVIDYYFKFNRENRGATSATLNEFSNPNLDKESCVTTIWEEQPKRDIKLYDTNFVDDAAIMLINDLLANSEDKILIAYNSLDGIINIIEQLGTNKEHCGILCSERSNDKVRDYLEDTDNVIDENGYLQKRVVFMTCAYFAGIDIMDRCHLISISSHLQPFTYLSTNRLTQIAGRCRNGNISEHIMYDIKQTQRDITFSIKEEYRLSLIDRANSYAGFLNSTRDAVAHNPELKLLADFIDSFVDYQAKTKVADNYPTKITRQNYISKEFLPAYFNIDAMIEKWELTYNLYSDKQNLYNELNKYHNVEWIDSYRTISIEQHNSDVISRIKERNAERLAEELEQAEITLIEWSSIVPDYELLDRLCDNPNKRVQYYFKAFKRLHYFVDANRLLQDLKGYCIDMRKLRNYNNTVIFWALEETHTFKLQTFAEFDYNPTSNERCLVTPINKLTKLKNIFRTQLMIDNINDDSLKEFFKCFFNTQRGSGGTIEYINGVNPLCFDGEPLRRITNEEDLQRLFIFPNSEL